MVTWLELNHPPLASSKVFNYRLLKTEINLREYSLEQQTITSQSRGKIFPGKMLRNDYQIGDENPTFFSVLIFVSE